MKTGRGPGQPGVGSTPSQGFAGFRGEGGLGGMKTLSCWTGGARIWGPSAWASAVGQILGTRLSLQGKERSPDLARLRYGPQAGLTEGAQGCTCCQALCMALLPSEEERTCPLTCSG